MPIKYRGFRSTDDMQYPFIKNPVDPLHSYGHAQYIGKNGYNVGYGPEGIASEGDVFYTEEDATNFDDNIIKKIVETMKKEPEWSGDKYNLLTHNCHHFIKELKKRYKALTMLDKEAGYLRCLLKVAEAANAATTATTNTGTNTNTGTATATSARGTQQPRTTSPSPSKQPAASQPAASQSKGQYNRAVQPKLNNIIQRRWYKQLAKWKSDPRAQMIARRNQVLLNKTGSANDLNQDDMVDIKQDEEELKQIKGSGSGRPVVNLSQFTNSVSDNIRSFKKQLHHKRFDQ